MCHLIASLDSCTPPTDLGDSQQSTGPLLRVNERLALGIFLSPNSPFPVAFSAGSPQGRGAREVIKETGTLLLWDFSAATSEIIPKASRYLLRPAKEHSEL